MVEWIEQFEMVASLCKWDEFAKLINLVTRLKGQAYAYYRSCDSQQQSNYSKLVERMKKRFTPVHIGVRSMNGNKSQENRWMHTHSS